MTTGVVAQLEGSFDCAGRAAVRAAGPLELRGPLRTPGFYYLRNVTTGVFAGDVYRTRLQAAQGARVRVESSSASKVYAMPSGSAVVEVELRADRGSRFVWGPHATILQEGASLRQSTHVMVQPGATVLLAESLVMGRIAAGQQFDFTAYEATFEVVDGCGETLYREAYRLERGADLEAAMGGLGVLTCVYALGEMDAGALGRIEALCSRWPLAGGGALPNRAGVVVKALTRSLSEGTAIAREALAALEDAGGLGSE
jgi:urease accessory protein